MEEMKTLTIGENTYEIADEKVRTELKNLSDINNSLSANADLPLYVSTPYNDMQTVHPSVIKLDTAISGYNYFMVHTPYAYANSQQENPCIAASKDGIHWVTPSGLTNPIDTPAANNYMSDGELMYNSDTQKLECWYREMEHNDTTQKYEIIYRKTSSDGINWSEREILNTSDNQNKLMSPSVIYENGIYKIWVVDYPAFGSATIDYYESETGADWNLIRQIKLNGFPIDRDAWHIDVLKDDDTYEMLVTGRVEDDYADQIIYYTKSDDNINYDDVKLLINKGGINSWDEKTLYRASFIKENGFYTVYYSGASTSNIWRIGCAKTTIANDIFSLKGASMQLNGETDSIILNYYNASNGEDLGESYLKHNRLRLRQGDSSYAMLEVRNNDNYRLHLKGQDSYTYGSIVTGGVQFNPNLQIENLGKVDEGTIVFRNNRHFVYENGEFIPVAIVKRGTSAERPTNRKNGDMYFDTTLGKPIWLKGDGIWVDATGTAV